MRGLEAFPPAVVFALLVTSCAPAQNQVGRVTVSIGQSSKFAASALSTTSDPIPENFCYVLYVTGEGINSPDATDQLTNCAGGGGQVFGLLARGSERTVELPAGKNYRFDLLGIRSSWLAQKGFNCSGTLSIEFGNGNEAEVFKINNTVIPEPPIRHFARGGLLLQPTEQTLVMNRSLEVGPYSSLIAATDPDIGTQFSCKAGATPIFPWAEKSLARAGESSVSALDTAHGIIRTGALYPQLRIAVPADISSINIRHFKNGVQQSNFTAGAPPSKSLVVAGPDLSAGNSATSNTYISVLRFYSGATLVDSALHRWVRSDNESFKTSVAGRASTGGQLNFAGLQEGYLFVNQSSQLDRVAFANASAWPGLFGSFIGQINNGTLLTNGMTESRFKFFSFSNRLFDVGRGRVSRNEVPGNSPTLATTADFTDHLGQVSGTVAPAGVGPDMIVALTGNLAYLSEIGTPGTLAGSFSTNIANTDATFDGIVFRQLRNSTTGAISAYYLSQRSNGSYETSACIDKNSVGDCASALPSNLLYDTNGAAGSHASEFFVYEGVPTFIRLSETPATVQILKYNATNGLFNLVAPSTATFQPAWNGKVQFLKSTPYRAPGSELSPFRDQEQLVAGGWTSCGSSQKCAVIYRSLDNGNLWTRIFLGALNTETSDAMPHRLPASYLRAERSGHGYNFLFLEKTISGSSQLLLSGTFSGIATSTLTYSGTATMTSTHTWSGTAPVTSTATSTGTDSFGGTFTGSDVYTTPTMSGTGPHTETRTNLTSLWGERTEVTNYTQTYSYSSATYSSTYTGSSTVTATFAYTSTAPGLYSGTTTLATVENGLTIPLTLTATHLETSTTTGLKTWSQSVPVNYIVPSTATSTSTSTSTGTETGTYRILIQDPTGPGY